MVLVDTSVWINHFRKGESRLQCLLYEEQVMIHPMVIGEVACGYLKKRKEILTLLQSLPQVNIANDLEVLTLINNKKLYGLGIGWIDVHLLTSALLTKVKIWTEDKSLKKAVEKLHFQYK